MDQEGVLSTDRASVDRYREASFDAEYLVDETWRALIDAAPREPVLPVALLLAPPLPSSSRPVRVEAIDGRAYFLKGSQNMRSLVSEHVVAKIGAAMGAPVPEVRLLDLPAEMAIYDPNLRGISPGLAHGSLIIENCSDTEYFPRAHEPENRLRYQLLAALFGMTIAADHQFICRTKPPRHVYSVDHGEFLPRRGAWMERDLRDPGLVELDRHISATCGFRPEERVAGCAALAGLAPEAIARAVAGPPRAWGLSDTERVSLAWFLGRRRDMLLALLCDEVAEGG